MEEKKKETKPIYRLVRTSCVPFQEIIDFILVVF